MVTTFKVPGIACSACASAITNAIKAHYPQVKVDIDIQSKTVTIDSSAKESIKNLIESAGYPVSGEV